MVKINMMSGKRNFGEDWIHIDGGDFPHIHSKDIYLETFKEDSVDLIYCSHGIAYFDREEVKYLLQEWYRVLKLGGILRVATPDFTSMSYLLQYAGDKFPLESFLGPLYGKMELNNEAIYHRTTYNFNSLSKLLKEIGFKNPNRYDWKATDHAQFDDHSQSYLPKMNKETGTLISLNVECTK